MNASKRAGNAISEYRIQKKDLVTGIPDIPRAYDKLSVVLVTLNEEMKTKDETLRMLNTLLSPVKGYKEKRKKLEEDFYINMEGNVGKELDIMCNLSGYVWSRGVEKGAEEEKKETAERMLCSGRLTYAEIASFTGLTEEKIREIEKELMLHV